MAKPPLCNTTPGAVRDSRVERMLGGSGSHPECPLPLVLSNVHSHLNAFPSLSKQLAYSCRTSFLPFLAIGLMGEATPPLQNWATSFFYDNPNKVFHNWRDCHSRRFQPLLCDGPPKPLFRFLCHDSPKPALCYICHSARGLTAYTRIYPRPVAKPALQPHQKTPSLPPLRFFRGGLISPPLFINVLCLSVGTDRSLAVLCLCCVSGRRGLLR